jgi:hypothetical protein
VSPVAKPLGGGWIVVASHEPKQHRLILRVEERDDGRLRIVELVFSDAEGLSGAMLRDLPLGAWEAQINAPEMAALLRARFAGDGPYALDDLVFAHSDIDLTPMPLDADDGGLEFHFPGAGLEPAVAIALEPQLVLGASGARAGKRPDDFYRAVAEAYSWLAGRGRRPAPELADINDVPPTTIHRWVKEARRRGLLGPGRRVVVYDPASPEVLEWAKRARQGAVTEWDLTHVPLLRAWASRIRRGTMSRNESFRDPIIEASDARLRDESVPAEERYLKDPVARLLFDSPKAWRQSADESGTQEPSGQSGPDSDEKAP